MTRTEDNVHAPTDLEFCTATELARMIRARHVSPVEVVEACLTRIEAVDPLVNGFITVAADQAREAARRAEEALSDGRELPPFHGVPISIKDLYDTAGIRTTMGTAAYAGRVPEADAAVVRRLRNAGFIVVGKANTAEFGIGSTDPVAYGPCRNPWDLDRTTGGSSGGSAATVAAEMCPVSLGGDGGGSIRIPASYCGVVGLKPARGRVSAAPKPQSLLAQPGPFSRTVEDAAAMLDVMAGPEPGDAFWAPEPKQPFLLSATTAPPRLRVAVTTELPGASTTVANKQAVERLARVVEELGHEVVEARPEWPGAESDPLVYTLYGAGFLAGEDELPPLDTMDPIFASLLAGARSLTLKQFLQAERAVFDLARRVVSFFGEHDVLVMATVASQPIEIAKLRAQPEDAETILPTSLWNLTGQPALSLPVAHDEDGMPVGVQLVGRPADEGTILALAAQVEEAWPWRTYRPPLCTQSPPTAR
jgi:amidase